MWLRNVVVLILVSAVSVTSQNKCLVDIGLKLGQDQRSPQITLHNPPNNECSYRIKAPFGHRIQVSCEVSPIVNVDRHSSTCNNNGIFISLNGSEDLSNATDINCDVGRVKKESEARSLFLIMQNHICTLSLIEPLCKCGRKNENGARIVNGKEAAVNEFPMMAGLVKGRSRKLFCGATISTTFLIVIHMKSHPDYTVNPVTNDIALVRTQSRIIFNEAVGPVCLPWKFRESTFTGESIEATGWGILHTKGKSPGVLMKVQLDVIDNKNCSTRWNGITSGQMCTYTPTKDTCQGDSGGPLFYTDPETERLYLVGIVSYGSVCASDKPAVNTRVTEYLDWIKAQTRDAPHYCVI